MGSKFQKWTREFRRAAKADCYARIIACLVEQGYTDAETLAVKAVDDTISLVGQVTQPGDPAGLLLLQVYNSTETRARYVLTFQGGEHELVRLYRDEIQRIDLAETYDSAVGFATLTIELALGGELAPDEAMKLEDQIREDFLSDYVVGEIELTFHRGGTFVQVEVADPE